jgi:hypothetical protein
MWIYGRMLRGVGESSLAIPYLRWEIVPRLVSGMCCVYMALKEAFLDLFSVACANDAFIAAHLELLRGWGKFSSHTIFKMGNGSKDSFWNMCCVHIALKEAFLDLFSIACANDAFIAAHLELLSSSDG